MFDALAAYVENLAEGARMADPIPMQQVVRLTLHALALLTGLRRLTKTLTVELASSTTECAAFTKALLRLVSSQHT